MNKYQEALKFVVWLYNKYGGAFDFEEFELLESLSELVLKATPKKVVRNTYNECPNCSEHFTDANDYCQYCGQALDWSEDE